MHVSTTDVHAETFLGLSSDALKVLQMAVADMLSTAQGERRVQLEAINMQLIRAIDGTEHG